MYYNHAVISCCTMLFTSFTQCISDLEHMSGTDFSAKDVMKFAIQHQLGNPEGTKILTLIVNRKEINDSFLERELFSYALKCVNRDTRGLMKLFVRLNARFRNIGV